MFWIQPLKKIKSKRFIPTCFHFFALTYRYHWDFVVVVFYGKIIYKWLKTATLTLIRTIQTLFTVIESYVGEISNNFHKPLWLFQNLMFNFFKNIIVLCFKCFSLIMLSNVFIPYWLLISKESNSNNYIVVKISAIMQNV